MSTVPKQFTTKPNDYPAPWWHQTDGSPRLYYSKAYRDYCAMRDARLPSSPRSRRLQVVTRTCVVCDNKFPTTAPLERSCGSGRCREQLAKAGLSWPVDGMTPCDNCGRRFRAAPGETLCGSICVREWEEQMRKARSRYISYRPRRAGLPWEDQEVMAELAADPGSGIGRGECAICDQPIYFNRARGVARSCSPEHELIRYRQSGK